MDSASFTIERNRALAPGVFELTLSGDASAIGRPGQFVEISVPGHFLRRPISVCDWTACSLTLLVRAVGSGTAWLERAAPGTALDLLLPLGNGFDISAAPDSALAVLAGGGIGIAPLYALAKVLLAQGRRCVAALGFRSGSDVFYANEFAALGCEVAIATEDGSVGTKGFITDVLAIRPTGQRDNGPTGQRANVPTDQPTNGPTGQPTNGPTGQPTNGPTGQPTNGPTGQRTNGPTGHLPYLFACGPTPMLRALAGARGFSGGQFSLEARMGCGFGACMGCTIVTARGPARVCREGPVFDMGDLKW